MNVSRTTLNRFLAAPSFEDEEKTRIARLLNVILLVLLVALALNAFVTLAIARHIEEDIFLSLGLAVIFVGARYLLQKGHLQLASFIVCGCIWAAVYGVSLTYGGVADGLFADLVIPILMAGLLINGKSALGFAALSIFVGFAQLLGMPSAELMSKWFGMTTLFVVASTLLYVFDKNIKQAIAAAHANAKQATDMNSALYVEIKNHHQTTDALRESEERYRQLIDLLPVAIAVTDIETRSFLYVNPAGAALFNAKNPDDLLGMRPADYLSAGDKAKSDARHEHIKSGQAVNLTEYKMQLPDGQPILIEGSSTLITYQGKPAGLSVFNDITERKAVQEALMEAELLRAELEKEKHYIALRENFISMASHQFRTPLSVIQASKDILESYDNRLTPERRLEHLGRISSQATFMKNMLEDMLTISKASVGMLAYEPAPTEFALFCQELVQQFQESHLTHRIVFSGHLPGFHLVDERLIQHALQNLLSNAVKYAPEGSEIRLDLRQDETGIQVQVIDHGIGIPAKDIPQLFDAFYRASNVRTYSGTGLGLSIVKTCVEAHGGSIVCESTEGSGTAFIIHLPLNRTEFVLG
ncbi:MAG: PAS domain-containing sensor histidine kinase [Chitinophagaceae bacterium]|nr:PAS domain-containing sensor histidine kinase [Anaerolineae bacterium]